MALSTLQKDDSPAAAFGRAHRFVLRLTWLYGALAIATAVLLTLPGWRLTTAAPVVAVVVEAVKGGVGGLLLVTLLLMLSALFASLALTAARHRVVAEPRIIQFGIRKRQVRIVIPQTTAGFAARIGQAVILSVGGIAICFLGWYLSSGAKAGAMPTSANANVLAAVAFTLAFPALVTERMMAAYSEVELPEAPALRRLLLLTTVILALAGCLELLRGFGFTWAIWLIRLAAVIVSLTAIELALRALARLFLPPPAAANARAAIDSIIADVITRGPRAPAQLIKTHLGLDFSRSWALSYLSAAIGPAIAATAVFCWLLTGLKLIDTGQRGVYERFGAPVAVLGPGLHVLLPWPLGQMRSVEFGTIHSVAAGTDQASDPDQRIGAEAIPPPSLNRLWTTTHATEAGFLVASESGGRQSFQTVSTEVLILYRIGLTDADALQAAYGAEDPDALVRQAGSRLAMRYFGSHTLEAVMGAQRETLQESLRAEIAHDIAPAKAGIEIVGVVVEEIHPPAAAAAAYHAVQAAENNAKASVSEETGLAFGTAGAAQSEAADILAKAKASATERIQAATAEAYRFAADKRAHDQSPRSFLMERSYNNLIGALGKSPMTLVDHHITTSPDSLLDMRASRQSAGPTPAAPATGQ